MEPDPRPSFRWRIIPAYSLLAFGGLLIIGFVLRLIMLAIQPLDIWARSLMEVGGIVLIGVAGLLSVYSGKMCLQRRWRVMLIALVAGYAAGVGGGFILDSVPPRMAR